MDDCPKPTERGVAEPGLAGVGVAELDLVALVCARLCHDLSGLLGSLTVTLEMASEAGEMASEAGEMAAAPGEAGEALSIANDAASALVGRLRLLRAAWAGEPEPLDLSALTALAGGLATGRINIDVSRLPKTTVFPPPMGRLVVNLLLLAVESLPSGGALHLAGGATDVTLRLDGPHAAWPAGLIGMLADPTSGRAALEDPRTMQGPLTALLAHHHNLRLTPLLATGAARSVTRLRLSVI
jgi:histidine phosphotransferase ChpT